MEWKEQIENINHLIEDIQFPSVVKELAALLESVMLVLYKEYELELTIEQKEKKIQYEKEHGTPDEYGFGQWIGLFSKVNYFEAVRRRLRKDLLFFTPCILDQINRLGINARHDKIKFDQELSTRTNIMFLYSAVSGIFQELELVEKEKPERPKPREELDLERLDELRISEMDKLVRKVFAYLFENNVIIEQGEVLDEIDTVMYPYDIEAVLTTVFHDGQKIVILGFLRRFECDDDALELVRRRLANKIWNELVKKVPELRDTKLYELLLFQDLQTIKENIANKIFVDLTYYGGIPP